MGMMYFCGAVEKKSPRIASYRTLLHAIARFTLAGCRNFAAPNEERKKIDKDRRCPPMSANTLREHCNFAAI
jgi:hypothetical protein